MAFDQMSCGAKLMAPVGRRRALANPPKNGLNQIVPSYLASYAIVDAGRPSTRQNKLTISNWALTIRTYLDGA